MISLLVIYKRGLMDRLSVEAVARDENSLFLRFVNLRRWNTVCGFLLGISVLTTRRSELQEIHIYCRWHAYLVIS
jgi:hypothetical protein